MVFFGFIIIIHLALFSSTNVYIKHVKVSYNCLEDVSWPKAINLVSNFQRNDGACMNEKGIKRIFTNRGDNVTVTFNISIDSGVLTKLVPPTSWFTRTSENSKKSLGLIELNVPHMVATETMDSFRSCGFSSQDMYRTLDKGPWIFAFNVMASLPPLLEDISKGLGISKEEAIRIISHCPYLIAQYARYRGRDINSTIEALLESGYTLPILRLEALRFPNILATPSDRIRGWMSLLRGYGIATEKCHFAKVVTKCHFMHTVDAPQLFDKDIATLESSANGALLVLEYMKHSNFFDLDKTIRSCPEILLHSAFDIDRRLNFLHEFLEKNSDFFECNPSISQDIQSIDRVSQKVMRSVLESYPPVVLYPIAQIKRISILLRGIGLREKEIILLFRRYPQLFCKADPKRVKEIISFLKFQCSLTKTEILHLFLQSPSILYKDINYLETKFLAT